jgi:hypothetical protein
MCHSTMKAWFVECCRDGCPSGRFSHLHRGSLELSQWLLGSIGFSLSKALLPQLLSLAGRPALGRVLVVPYFFHLRMMEATVILRTFNAAKMFGTLPRSVPRHNPVSELYGQLLRPHGLVFARTCNVNCGTLYRQVSAFPNHIQSIEFTTGGLQSSCLTILRMINGNRMHQRSILSLKAKDLNTYVNAFYIFNKANIKKMFFALSLWGIVCRSMNKTVT